MLICSLGLLPYETAYQNMVAFTNARTPDTPDELWLCQHPPVYTLGLAAQAQHLLQPGDIAVVASNRGGQVTYHGPGQLVAYPLLNLQRAGLLVKTYVHRLEEAVLRTLSDLGVTGHRVAGAPGIYVRPEAPFDHRLLTQRPLRREADQATTGPVFDGVAKIAALGIKVTRHCTYHGLSLNVAMDLSPFERINPCGYPGLQTTDLRSLGIDCTVPDAAAPLAHHLSRLLAPNENTP